MIAYYEQNDLAIIDDYRFRRDKRTGYYLSSKLINGKRTRLHVYVWTKYMGVIPKGYHVHHIDENKFHNDIENLELMLCKDHLTLHGNERDKEELIDKLINQAIPKSKEWHRSEKGHNWHKKHYQEMKSAIHRKEEFICENCGKVFIAVNNGKNRFCSNACKTAKRVELRVDDEERSCIICGNTYKVNKYHTKKTCCKECKSALRRNTINKVYRET